MKVIGVVGFPASGKGEFSKIAQEMGIPVVVMGDVIREEVKKAGLLPTDENLGRTANLLRATGGMDAVARLCVPVIEAAHAPVVLVDGIRGDSEVRVFRGYFPGFVLVGIDSPFDLRLLRVNARGRSDDNHTRDSLKARDERESVWGLRSALGEATYTISNTGTLEDFSRQVRDLLSRIREGGVI
jgi:dephospho-CoA kinase